MRRKKNAYKAEFKSKVVIELITGQCTLNELAAKYQIAPSTLSVWYKQFQEGAAEIFRKGSSDQDRILKEKEQEIVITAKGGPSSLLSGLAQKNLMKSLALADRIRLVSLLPEKYL